ncbi:MAG: hypothetical protein V7L01_15130 [Nostoc sp.]|uniref:hypothetical protein n=1 Tax=Nostoc sp. TaxID=1180 RepID=UPI002FF94CC9
MPQHLSGSYQIGYENIAILYRYAAAIAFFLNCREEIEGGGRLSGTPLEEMELPPILVEARLDNLYVLSIILL